MPTIQSMQPEHRAACAEIVRSLPAWFGDEDGLFEAEGYLKDHEGLVAIDDGRVIGYLTYAVLFPDSAEISWMAIDSAWHRRGVGRELIAALEETLIARGVRYLSVKTLADTHPSEEYVRTRAFYTRIGFSSQMVFPEHWDAANPCLLMVKSLRD